MTLLAITLVVDIYPAVFWIGHQNFWWSDPDGKAWLAFVVTAIIGASLTLVLIAASIHPSALPPFGRLLGGAAVLSVGPPLAVVAGVVGGLAGFSCSSGVVGEGCSGGSQAAGLLIAAMVLAIAVWLAWLVGHPRR